MGKPMFKVGDKVKIASDNDNENYDKFRGKTLIVTHVAKNTDEHRGYDDSMEGMALYDFKGVPFSLYEYELESKYAKGSTIKGVKQMTKQELLSKYKGKYLDLIIGEDGKHEVIGVSSTPKKGYLSAEEWYDDLYAKGSTVKSEIAHYKVNGVIFILYDDALDYCDENKLPYSKIIKTKKYAKGSTVKGGITIHELENRLSEHTQVIDDRTLDSEEIHNWGADNVTEYKKAQNEIDKIKYKGKGWEIYGWYDVSSFDYWIIKQEEQNYIQITIKFKNETVKEEEVDEIADALDSALADADRITNKYNYNPSKFGKGSTVKGGENWYTTIKPNEKLYVKYDFARSSEQAKNMLRDLAEGSPIAHKSTSEGGLYNLYVKRGSIFWREKYAKGSTVKGNYVPKGYKGQLYDVFAIKNGKWEKLNDEVGGLTKKHAENMVNAINKGDGQNFTKGYSEGYMDKEGVRSFQKYANGGYVEGGTADLSTKEKATMYVWIDNFLEKYSGDDNRSQSLDMYKEFAKKFNKSKEQTHDIIDSGWARSRGYYEKAQAIKKSANRYGNGGGVAVSSESGLAVGTNADLLMNQNNLQYRNGGRFEFRNTISRYNKMKELYQTNRKSLEEINDYVDENYNGKKEEFIPLIYSVFPTTIKELGLTKEDFVFWLNDPNYYQGYFSEDNIGENDYARGGNMSMGFNYEIGGL